MLTVDLAGLGVGPGSRVLDVGCGAGRHSVEAARLGAVAVALDLAPDQLRATAEAAAGAEALLGAPLGGGHPRRLAADATRLPFADGSFDVVVASEVLEHLPDDAGAVAELARVVCPGGRVAVSVPTALPERVCWALSREYHETPGGHVRIYAAQALRARLRRAGLRVTASTHVHGLHTPYWWLRCAVGVTRQPLPVRLYHRFLVWDLMARPLVTRLAERALAPLIGKSLAVYCERPRGAATPGDSRGAAAA